MFEAQTYDKVLEEILSRAPDGIDLRQGSIFYDAVAGIAFKIAKYYADLEQVFEMVFLVTATGDYLTLKAEEYAVYRQAAATAKYRIKYDGELPELGTRFFCSGQYFVLAQDDALGIYIEAEKAGTEANDIPAGTSVVPTDTQRSLTACSIVEELEPGADDEDDESLRKRVQEKIAGPAENGNQQHYKTWCESISGVGRARIVPLWAGENTVKGILIDTEGGPASEAVVQRVQEYIDPGGTGLGEGQANIGAHFTATSATAKRVNISFSVTLAKGGDLASVRSAAQTALKAQIKSINLTTDDSETPTLRISTVGNTIYSLLGVLDYANLRFNGQTANVEAGKEEVFVLGEANIGAHFTATSATAKRVNISFSVTLAKGGDLASVRSAAQTALKAQIKSINLTTDDSETPTLRISTVGNTIYSLLGVLDYANLRFNGQTANVEAGKEEVFVLGEVTVSETNPVS